MKLKPLFTSLLAAPLFAAQPITIAKPAKGDLAAAEVVSVQAKQVAPSTERIAVSWPIDSGVEVDLDAAPAASESKYFRREVTTMDLSVGVELPLSAPGALVQITPGGDSARDINNALEPMDLIVVSPQGDLYDKGSAMAHLAGARELAKGENHPLPHGASAFRIKDELGAGVFTLFAENLAHKRHDRYVIQVLEKQSDVALSLQPERSVFFTKGEVAVNLSLTVGKVAVENASFRAKLVAPNGRAFPMDVKNGRAFATVPEMNFSGVDGLWEVLVDAEGQVGKLPAARFGRTAFSVTAPTARLTGYAELLDDAHALEAAVELEVGVAGRYELRGLLYGHNAEGKLVPVAVGHVADQLEAGISELILSFDRGHAADADTRAPFVVKDLRVIHQDRLSLVHRQSEGFVIEAAR